MRSRVVLDHLTQQHEVQVVVLQKYLDRLSVLRNQIFVLDHMYMSLFSTCGWILRLHRPRHLPRLGRCLHREGAGEMAVRLRRQSRLWPRF